MSTHTSSHSAHSERAEPSAAPIVDRAGVIVSDTLIAEDSGAITSDVLLREAARIASLPRESLPELTRGEIVGRYLIVSTLGKGGMGVVYKAEDTKLSRMIALKVLATDGKDQRGRFLREAKSAAAVEHNNIATIHDYGEDDGRVFIAMELVRGRSLDKLLGGKPLPIHDAMRIAREIARGLAAAHARGIIHRDIKPGNVMISDDGDVKLLDFGLAKRADRDEDAPSLISHEHFTTAEKSVVGTPGYMSPEQVKGDRVDARTDVFSFGVMLYEMLTGRRPFIGRSAVEVNIAIVRDEPEPPSSVNLSTPSSLESLVTRCLRKNPAERYMDASHLLRELEAQSAMVPASVWDAVVTTRSASASRSRSRWALALSGIVVAGLPVAWFSVNRSSPTSAQDVPTAVASSSASAVAPPASATPSATSGAPVAELILSAAPPDVPAPKASGSGSSRPVPPAKSSLTAPPSPPPPPPSSPPPPPVATSKAPILGI